MINIFSYGVCNFIIPTNTPSSTPLFGYTSLIFFFLAYAIDLLLSFQRNFVICRSVGVGILEFIVAAGSHVGSIRSVC